MLVGGSCGSERLTQLVCTHAFLSDPQLLEDRLQQGPTSQIADRFVKLRRVEHHLKGRLDEFGSDAEIDVDVVELRSDAAALKLDVVETAAHLGTGLSRALSGEVEQVLFFGVESFQPAVQLPVQQHRGSALIGDGLTHGSSSLGDEVGAELHFGEVLGDVPLDVGDRDRPSTAGLVLGAGTEEVEILAASSDAAVEEQAPFTTLVVAAAAPQQPFQEMVVHSLSFATSPAGSEDVLHSLE